MRSPWLGSHIEARLGPHLLDEEQRGDPQLLPPERRPLDVHEAPPQPHVAPGRSRVSPRMRQQALTQAYQTAFIMRRLMVKYSSPMRMTGNWSCTVPPLGCARSACASRCTAARGSYLHPRHEPLVLLQVPDHLPAARGVGMLPRLAAVHELHAPHIHALHPTRMVTRRSAPAPKRAP